MTTQEGTFGTTLDCIDGRVQRLVEDWAVKEFGVKWVDSITEPGMDGVLSRKNRFWRRYNNRKKYELKRKAQISAKAHGSQNLVIAGHHDCAGNPVDEATHKEHIKRSVIEVRGWKLFGNVIGVWVNKSWEIEKVM